MATSSLKSERIEHSIPSSVAGISSETRGVIAWSSLFFAFLQSVCTFFAAVDGLRLVIGVGSLAVSASVGATMDRIHSDWIRVPMIVLALVGSLLNLLVLWQIRRLRVRPAAQWRVKSPSPGKLRMERVQFWLSIATLVLVGVEEFWHFRACGHL